MTSGRRHRGPSASTVGWVDVRELTEIVGPGGVVTDPDLMVGEVTDWTGRWVGSSPAVVFPRTTGEVVALVLWCRHNRVAIVPQGGNTGMVGASVPLAGEIVMKLTRMTAMSVDATQGQATAQAGVTLAALQGAARDAGWVYGVDHGARDTATVGGTIATNAGGLHVLRYGSTRAQLLGIEAVTGAGEVVGDLRGLVKDNTGYHLPSLLAGSEGTLAIITKACVRLVNDSAETVVVLLGFPDAATAIDAVPTVRRKVQDLHALELFFADGLDLVCRTFDLPRPLADFHGAYLLVEAAGAAGVAERLGPALSGLDLPADATAVAAEPGQRRRLWRYREAHTEAISLLGIAHKLDISVPLDVMAEFVHEVRARVASCNPEAALWIFGHAGDGNLHVNITGVDTANSGLDELVLTMVARCGGSISAEHGVGRAKADFLHLNRSAAEIAVARRIKAAFDPDGILNPGVLFT